MEVLLLEDERIDDLQRNQYKIIQNQKKFCFGMDAVLLTNYSDVKNNSKIVDLGTGTGIIPILLSGKRNYSHAIGIEIQEKVAEMDFAEFKEKLDEAAKYIVFHLRDHIFKENYILYPTAMESISEKEIWKKMKDDCDKIGYCTFTPNK